MEPLAPSDPARIASYELLARLGAGGMGLVYLARSPGKRLVAVKVIHTHLTDDPRFLRRFRREVEAARSVSGFYTAPVIDADTDSRPAWLATAHVAGPALDAVVRTRGPLPGRTVTALAAALAEALKAIHAAGLVHRDLKPSNILLAEDGPRVIDFGIVHAADGADTTGGLIGTPGYMSPEQVDDEDIGPASDVFSLGGVLHFAATGRPPFGTGDIRAVLHRVLTQDPDLARVPEEQRDLIGRCLAKEPSMRPTPDEILAELADSVAEGPVDWTAGPQSTLIDEYTTRVLSYTGPKPDPSPRPDPSPKSEPSSRPEPSPIPEPRWKPEPNPRTEPRQGTDPNPRTDPVHGPRPEPQPVTPRPHPPSPPDTLSHASTRLRRRGWVLLAIIALVGTAAYVVLDLGGLGRGGGFRPWSVDDAVGAAVVSDGVVYIGKKDGTAAHDARTGRRRWESKAGEKEIVVNRYGAVVIVWSPTRLSALDAQSGKRLWRIPVDEDSCATRSGATGHIMVVDQIERKDGPDDTRISAVDSATGARVWSKTLGRISCTTGMRPTEKGMIVVTPGKDEDEDNLVFMAVESGERWRLTTEDVESFTADDTNVYTATEAEDGYRIRAYAADTGRRRWDVALPSPDGAGGIADPEMAVEGSNLYVLEDGTLYAFQGSDGRRLWKSAISNEKPGDLFVVGGTAYIDWDDSKNQLIRTVVRTSLAAVDVKTGRRLWRKRIDSDARFVSAEGRTAYIASFKDRSFRPDDNSLIAFDVRTGRQRWKRGMEVRSAIVAASGVLYVLNDDKLEAIDAATGHGP